MNCRYYRETYKMGVSIWKCDNGNWYYRRIKIRPWEDCLFESINEKWRPYPINPVQQNDRWTQITEQEAFIELL